MEQGEPGSVEYFRWFYLDDWSEPRAIEERWHPDLVLVQTSAMPDTEGTFHGYEGLRAVFAELGESFERIVWKPTEVRGLDGDRFLVRVMVTGRGRGSGIELDNELGHLFTLRDGRAARLEVYEYWEQALEAAAAD